MKAELILISVIGLAAAANAQLSPIAPFTGNASESFESFAGWSAPDNVGSESLSIMGGKATLGNNSGGTKQNFIWNDGSSYWGLGANGVARAKTGRQGLGLQNNTHPTKTIDVRLTFATGAFDWGTYITNEDIYDRHDTTISFFGQSGNQIGATQTFCATSGQMAWIGWHSDQMIKSIVFSGTSIAPAMDDMRATMAVPEPGSILALAAGLVTLRRRRK